MRSKHTTHYPPRPPKGFSSTKKKTSASANAEKISGAKQSANASSSGKANPRSNGISSNATNTKPSAAAAGSTSSSGLPRPSGSGAGTPSSISQKRKAVASLAADSPRRKRTRNDSSGADPDPEDSGSEADAGQQAGQELEDVTDWQKATFIEAWRRVKYADQGWLARNQNLKCDTCVARSSHCKLIPGSALCAACEKLRKPCSRRRAERKWRATALAKLDGMDDDVLEELIEALGLNAMKKNFARKGPGIMSLEAFKASRGKVKASDEAGTSKSANRGASQSASTKDAKTTSAAGGSTRLRKPRTLVRMAVFEDDPPSEALLADEVHVWFGSDGEVIDDDSDEEEQVKRTPSLVSLSLTPTPEPIPQFSHNGVLVPTEPTHELHPGNGAMAYDDPGDGADLMSSFSFSPLPTTQVEAPHLAFSPSPPHTLPDPEFQSQPGYPQDPYPPPSSLEVRALEENLLRVLGGSSLSVSEKIGVLDRVRGTIGGSG